MIARHPVSSGDFRLGSNRFERNELLAGGSGIRVERSNHDQNPEQVNVAIIDGAAVSKRSTLNPPDSWVDGYRQEFSPSAVPGEEIGVATRFAAR